MFTNKRIKELEQENAQLKQSLERIIRLIDYERKTTHDIRKKEKQQLEFLQHELAELKGQRHEK